MDKKNFGISILMTMAMFLGACAQQSSSGRSNITNRGSDADTTPDTGNVGGRYCETPIQDVDEWTLTEFFAPSDPETGDSQAVDDLEDAPTFCHKFQNGLGTTAKLFFMIEYEDRYGIRELVLNPSSTSLEVLATGIKTENNVRTLDVIYKDGMGLIRVRATGSSTSDVLQGEISFHNFPETYEEALASAIAELAERCTNGGTYNGVTYTTAYCLGYSSTSNWWTNPNSYMTAEQKKKAMALEILDDPAKTQVLGEISLNIKANTWP